jgi:hypothetical protein
MRFNLDTSGLYYKEEEKDKLEKLGFKFTGPKRANAAYRKSPTELYIDFNSLDELVKFIKEHGSIVIQPPEVTDEWYIEIYDDYRE